MMSLTFGLFTQVSGSGPLGPLVISSCTYYRDKKEVTFFLCIHSLNENKNFHG